METFKTYAIDDTFDTLGSYLQGMETATPEKTHFRPNIELGSYLQGMETLFSVIPLTSVSFARILPTRNGNPAGKATGYFLRLSSDPTYKEWKRSSIGESGRSFLTALGSYLQGMETTAHTPNRAEAHKARILPTRNGNLPVCLDMRANAEGSDPTYKEWKQ